MSPYRIDEDGEQVYYAPDPPTWQVWLLVICAGVIVLALWAVNFGWLP